jgi:hypothetical protein
VIGALEPRSHDWLPTSAVIEGTDAEQSRNREPVHCECRRALRSSNERKRDADTKGDRERAQMKQPPEEWPRQTFREQVRIGRGAEAPLANQARTPARTGPAWPSR